MEAIESASFGGAPVTCMVGLPDGSLAFGFLTVVRVWSSPGVLVSTLDGQALACGPSGEVVSGSDDTTVKVWSGQDRACVLTCKGHSGGVTAVAVSPLDGTIVSGSQDMTAKVWSRSTGECLATLLGHSREVSGVCVLSNGHVLTGSQDATVRVWGRGSSTSTAVYEQRMPVRSLAPLPANGFAVGCGTTFFRTSLSNDGVSVWRDGVQAWKLLTDASVSHVAVRGNTIVACTDAGVLLLHDGNCVGQWRASKPCAAVLPSGRLAVADNVFACWRCYVLRFPRTSRLACIDAMVTAWLLHAGVPPAADDRGVAGVLARTLSLRRFCRPRGESDVGRQLEIVEPFARDIANFM